MVNPANLAMSLPPDDPSIPSDTSTSPDTPSTQVGQSPPAQAAQAPAADQAPDVAQADVTMEPSGDTDDDSLVEFSLVD